MTLRQVEVFCAVAKHESVKLAAQELRLSSGTVSQMMARLERNVGFKLFDSRIKRAGVHLTPGGKMLLLDFTVALGRMKQAFVDPRGLA